MKLAFFYVCLMKEKTVNFCCQCQNSLKQSLVKSFVSQLVFDYKKKIFMFNLDDEIFKNVSLCNTQELNRLLICDIAFDLFCPCLEVQQKRKGAFGLDIIAYHVNIKVSRMTIRLDLIHNGTKYFMELHSIINLSIMANISSNSKKYFVIIECFLIMSPFG